MKSTLTHKSKTVYSNFYSILKYRSLVFNHGTFTSCFGRQSSLILILFMLSFSLTKGQDSTNKVETIKPNEFPAQLVHFDFPSDTLMRIKNIECGEDKSTRWISVSIGTFNSTNTPIAPLYYTDAIEGHFSLELAGVDPTTYTDSRLVRDHGNYPIQYQVISKTPQSLVITGKTVPYDRVISHYSFNQNKYYFAFIFSKHLQGSNSKSPDENLIGVLTTPSQGHPLGTVKSSGMVLENASTYSSIFKDSELIIGFVLVTILIAVGAFLLGSKISNRKKVSAQGFTDVFEEKTAVNDSQIEKVDEDSQLSEKNSHEMKIRGLMESNKISYDEAALRVQYNFIEYNNA